MQRQCSIMHVTSPGQKSKFKIWSMVSTECVPVCTTMESKILGWTLVSQGPSILLYPNYLYYILYLLCAVVYFMFVSSLNSHHSRNPSLSESFEMSAQEMTCLFFSADHFNMSCLVSPGVTRFHHRKTPWPSWKEKEAITKTIREVGTKWTFLGLLFLRVAWIFSTLQPLRIDGKLFSPF